MRVKITVWEYADGKPTVRYIAVHLLGKSNGDWGSKDMDETSGPYNYDCPLSYLDEATEPANEWARQWREKVRAHHATKATQKATAKRVAVGCKVRLSARYGGVLAEVTRTEKTKVFGTLLEGKYKGGHYKLPRAGIVEVLA